MPAIVAFGQKEEESDADYMGHYSSQEGGKISKMLSDDSSEKDSESHSQVPGSQDGGVGSGSAAVRSEVDDHVLHTRPHMPVAQSDQ